ncbi:MAG: DUF3256 family protein [Muribaculaceae bacterium]|nr:DUF3256 family protein [Muribaculaceae bacterium]
MRFFIRKKDRKIKKAAFGSALFMVSAFALLNPASSYANKNTRDSDESANSGEVAGEALTARKIFEKIESSAIEILPLSTRLDMLDYWDVDSVYKASNAMEGLSWLESVTPNYLKVHVTSVSSLEIKLLPLKKDKIVMTIYTVGDSEQAEDSQVKFYDENLKELPTEKYLGMPQLKDFFEIPKGSATKMKEIEEMIPFPTIAFTANPDNDNLEARLTVEKYINQDDWNIAKLFVKPAVVLEWKKGKYRK